MGRSTSRTRQITIALVSWGMAALLIHCAGNTGQLPFLSANGSNAGQASVGMKQSRIDAPGVSPFHDGRVRVASILWCD